jgi:hypothetical protein
MKDPVGTPQVKVSPINQKSEAIALICEMLFGC